MSIKKKKKYFQINLRKEAIRQRIKHHQKMLLIKNKINGKTMFMD